MAPIRSPLGQRSISQDSDAYPFPELTLPNGSSSDEYQQSQDHKKWIFQRNLNPDTFIQSTLPYTQAQMSTELMGRRPSISMVRRPSVYSDRRGSRSQIARRQVSHAAKKPDGHIPRPPNCFMVYRSWCKKNKEGMMASVLGANQQKVSLISGTLWKELPEEAKEVFRQEADRIKAEHAAKYPDYKFQPVSKKGLTKRKAKKMDQESSKSCLELAEKLKGGVEEQQLAAGVRNIKDELDGVARRYIPNTSSSAPYMYRRSSSCPIPTQLSSSGTSSSSTRGSTPNPELGGSRNRRDPNDFSGGQQQQQQHGPQFTHKLRSSTTAAARAKGLGLIIPTVPHVPRPANISQLRMTQPQPIPPYRPHQDEASNQMFPPPLSSFEFPPPASSVPQSSTTDSSSPFALFDPAYTFPPPGSHSESHSAPPVEERTLSPLSYPESLPPQSSVSEQPQLLPLSIESSDVDSPFPHSSYPHSRGESTHGTPPPGSFAAHPFNLPPALTSEAPASHAIGAFDSDWTPVDAIPLHDRGDIPLSFNASTSGAPGTEDPQSLSTFISFLNQNASNTSSDMNIDFPASFNFELDGTDGPMGHHFMNSEGASGARGLFDRRRSSFFWLRRSSIVGGDFPGFASEGVTNDIDSFMAYTNKRVS